MTKLAYPGTLTQRAAAMATKTAWNHDQVDHDLKKTIAPRRFEPKPSAPGDSTSKSTPRMKPSRILISNSFRGSTVSDGSAFSRSSSCNGRVDRPERHQKANPSQQTCSMASSFMCRPRICTAMTSIVDRVLLSRGSVYGTVHYLD